MACVCVDVISVQPRASAPAAGREPCSPLRSQAQQPRSAGHPGHCRLPAEGLPEGPGGSGSFYPTSLRPFDFRAGWGLSPVGLTAALGQCNFVFVLHIQRGSCWHHCFLVMQRGGQMSLRFRLLMGKLSHHLACGFRRLFWMLVVTPVVLPPDPTHPPVPTKPFVTPSRGDGR